MPSIEDQKVYDANRKLYCRRDFKFSGRPFLLGKLFPAKQLAVTRRKIQSLINANYLTQKPHLAPVEKNVVSGQSDPKPPLPDSDPPVDEDDGISREKIDAMDQDQLYAFCDEYDLDVAVEEFGDDLDALRDAIWAALDDEPESSDELTTTDRGGGWFDVYYRGQKVNEKAMRENKLEEFKAAFVPPTEEG